MKKQAVLTILLVLTVFLMVACTANDDEVRNLRNHLRGISSAEYLANITASFPSREAEFSLSYKYSKDKDDRISVVSPGEVAGVSLTVSENGSELHFDGAILELGRLDDGGLTPFSAMPALLGSWINGAWVEAENTRIFGRDAMMIITRNESETGKSEHRTWFSREDFTPLYAEIFSDGRRVITCKFERAEHTLQ